MYLVCMFWYSLVCLRLMNGFNSLKHVQQLDAHHSKLKKAQGERKKKFGLGQKNRSGQKKKKKDKKQKKLKKEKEYLWKMEKLMGHDDIFCEFVLCTFNLLDVITCALCATREIIVFI